MDRSERRQAREAALAAHESELARLKGEAQRFAEKRGHTLGEWSLRLKRFGADSHIAFCTKCTRSVMVDPNRAERRQIFGGAVAINCPK